MIRYSYSLLRQRITEKYGTQAAFAKELEISKTHLGRLLNGRACFSQSLITKCAELLFIPDAQIADYFFAKKG